MAVFMVAATACSSCSDSGGFKPGTFCASRRWSPACESSIQAVGIESHVFMPLGKDTQGAGYFGRKRNYKLGGTQSGIPPLAICSWYQTWNGRVFDMGAFSFTMRGRASFQNLS